RHFAAERGAFRAGRPDHEIRPQRSPADPMPGGRLRMVDGARAAPVKTGTARRRRVADESIAAGLRAADAEHGAARVAFLAGAAGGKRAGRLLRADRDGAIRPGVTVSRRPSARPP